MSTDPLKAVQTVSLADARAAIRHVFVRNFVLDASIGIHDHERVAPQRVRFNLDLAVREGGATALEGLDEVVCYEKISDGVRQIVDSGHVNLVERLAEDVATMCLRDPRVVSVRVKVEKLDIMADAESVGVEIERFNSAL